MMNNKQILAKELELIFYNPEVNKVPMNWEGIAEILLAKLQKLDKKNIVKEIMKHYTYIINTTISEEIADDILQLSQITEEDMLNILDDVLKKGLTRSLFSISL